MALIVVEREFTEPTQLSAPHAPDDAESEWPNMRRVAFLHSYLSLSRTSMICFYDARDAQSVRISQRTAGRPLKRIWAAQSTHFAEAQPVPPGFRSVVVERDMPPATNLAQLDAYARSGGDCLASHRVVPVASFLSLDGRRGICVVAAPDAESARLANRQLGMPFTRAWAASFHTAEAAG